MPRISLASPAETARLAGIVGGLFRRLGPGPAGATVIGLVGNLGAGKTTFTRTFLKALGVRGRVMSPTFIIMKSFPLTRKSGFKTAYHLDAYRIDAGGLRDLGFDAILADPRNIVLIEWADRVRRVLPKNTFWITIGHGKREKHRILSIR